jgi:hypothetical protein
MHRKTKRERHKGGGGSHLAWVFLSICSKMALLSSISSSNFLKLKTRNATRHEADETCKHKGCKNEA